MNTINTNPAALDLISAWHAAKSAERQWSNHRQALEEQILSLHPAVLPALEEQMLRGNTMSASAQMADLVVEAKRSADLDQAGTSLLLAEHPDLLGSVIRCRFEIASTKAMFGLFEAGGKAAEALKALVKFRASRPYFAAK